MGKGTNANLQESGDAIPTIAAADRSGIRFSEEPSARDDGTLSDVCSLVSDQCDPTKTDHEIYVGLEHVDPGAFVLSRHGTSKDVVSAKNRFKKNDILYGKLRPYLDKAVLAQQEGICSTDILVFRPRENVCPVFVLAHIHSKPFVEYAVQTTHGVNHPRTSWAALKEFRCAVPPFSEQEKVAAVLWKIQKAVGIEDAVVRNARDLKKSLLPRLFTHGLRGEPLKETEIGPVPESWDAQLLSQCAHVQTGVAKGRPIDPSHLIEVPYLRVANVQHGRLDLSEMKKIQIRPEELGRYSLRKDDVVLTEGGDFDKLGRGFIWDGQIEPCVHQNHIFAVRPHRDHLLPHYLAYLIQSPHGRGYFLTVAHKTTNLACINTSKLKALPVPMPSLGEQEEIANILQTVDRKIDIHESKKSSLRELFKTMLHKLMTAQIRVNDLDIDTSEVMK
jgi:type I restriction enzyme S subunit